MASPDRKSTFNYARLELLTETGDPSKGVLPGMKAKINRYAPKDNRGRDVARVVLTPLRRILSGRQRTTLNGIPKFKATITPTENTRDIFTKKVSGKSPDRAMNALMTTRKLAKKLRVK